MIGEDSELGDPRDKNSKTGVRQVKGLHEPDFRRKADDELKEPNIMSINGARSDSCSWRTSRFLLRKIRSVFM